MRIYWTNNLEFGNLGLMARPRGNDWLRDDLNAIKVLGTDILVSLLEQEETTELQLQNEPAFCKELSIEFISFPIKDRAVPKDVRLFKNLVEQLSDELDKGKKIVVHCRMGIGRTGMLAAGILIHRGMNPNNVFQCLSKIRTIQVPDTHEQSEWVKTTLYNKH